MNKPEYLRTLHRTLASILSKKAAEDLSCLLLDLKCGPAAFMKDMEKAKELADVLVKCGLWLHAVPQNFVVNVSGRLALEISLEYELP